MPRIDNVKRDSLTAPQQEIFDDIMRTRPAGPLTGPFSVWLHTPEIALHADRLTNCFRVHSKLDKRLIEMIILMMCRSATVKYAWSVHAPLGLQAGLAQETIDAIRERKQPDLERDDERVVYELVTELLATKTVSTTTFESAKATLGLEGLIEAVSCAGCYGMIGLVLNTFEIPARPGYPLT
jgi:4-carboxymuconolactone decarboxylase